MQVHFNDANDIINSADTNKHELVKNVVSSIPNHQKQTEKKIKPAIVKENASCRIGKVFRHNGQSPGIYELTTTIDNISIKTAMLIIINCHLVFCP